MTTQSHRQSRHHPQTVEIIVIGAGFGDIYAVQEFADELGPSLTGFDESGDPRGAWHWNRFPGALSDTKSHRYRFVRRGSAGQHLEGLLRPGRGPLRPAPSRPLRPGERAHHRRPPRRGGPGGGDHGGPNLHRAESRGGKKPPVLFHLGGSANYRKVLDDVVKSAIAASS